MSRSGDDLRSAVSLLTVFGSRRAGGSAELSPRSIGWYPVVGAVLGGVLGIIWWCLGQVFPPLVAAVAVVGFDAGLTGMLHLDGVVDSADGLLAHLPRERRLDVMAEPQVGAFGAIAAVIVVLGRIVAVGALGQVSLIRSVALFIGVIAASRAMMGLGVCSLARARQSGMAAAVARHDRAIKLSLGVSLALAMAITLLWSLAGGPVAVAAEVLGAVAVYFLALRRLGGVTGDVLGAAGVVGETLGLLVATARW